jgi:hypothetical protein
MRGIISVAGWCGVAFLIAGCAGGRTVSVRVEMVQPLGGTGSQPVAGAYVQVVPVAMAPVPLPVNLETLQEAGAAGTSGFTDARGIFRFQMAGERPHEVSVSSPIGVADESKRYTWRGHLDVHGRLEPMDEVQGIKVTTTEATR